MQLVPLSTDGRVSAATATTPDPALSRVALEPDRDGVRVVALGPGVPRPVGRLTALDAAAYGPVLRPLHARGIVGSCPARVTPGGTLVLDLAPSAECVLENLPGDLLLLPAERTVTVTREEYHQDVLAGRGGRVVVALHPCPVTAGKYAGQPGLAVTLDGRPVGELTRLMAERYLPMVEQVGDRGGRVGCEALLRPHHRGVQVELRLPAVEVGVRSAPDDAPSVPVRAPVAAGAAPDPATRTAVVPAPRAAPAPTAVAPLPPLVSPPSLRTPRPARRRARRWIGASAAAVLGVMVLAGVVGNGGRSDTTRTTTAAADVTRAAPPTDTSRSTAASTTSALPTETARAEAPVVVPAERTTRRTTTTRTTTTRTTTTPTTVTRPVPRATSPATSSPTRTSTTRTSTTRTSTSRADEPPAPAGSGCDPNYSGCVPIASDVDCEGGSGNGPAYVRGPVRVTGKDVYRLDNNHDGIGCN